MDIMQSDIREPVSPQPWVLHHDSQPLEQLIMSEIQSTPQVTPDQIVERLAKKDVQVSGVYVAALIAKLRANPQAFAEASLPPVSK